MKRDTGLAQAMLAAALALGLLVGSARASEWDEGWELSVSGLARAEFAVDEEPRLGDGPCARVTVQRASFTGWQAFLRTEAQVQAGKRYRVSLDTVAAQPGRMDICVQAAQAPYEILHLATVAAGPEPRSYTFVTTHAPQDGPVHVGVWLGGSARGDYWFDNVAIEELSADELAALEAAPEGWRNGDFSAGVDGWEVRQHAGAVGAFTVQPDPRFGDGNHAQVVVTNATDTSWHVQFVQVFNVKKGKRYMVTFAAASEPAGPMPVAFQVPPPDNDGL